MFPVKSAIFFVAIFSTAALGQISVTRLPDLPKHFCGLGSTSDEGWIERYEIRYMTQDRYGVDHASSGLVAFQKNLEKTSDPLLYLHATTSKLEVPSKGSFESKFVACHALSSKRVLIAPDYIGMGDDEQTHGYMVRDEVNRATLDLLNTVANWFDKSRLSHLVTIAGYSQGGHSALSFHHFLDHENTDFQVVKTYAMSAPANLSEDMLSTILEDRPSNNTTYLMALVLFNYQQYYGDVFHDPPFLEKYSEAEALALAMDNGKLKDMLPRDPRNALRPEFVNDLISDPIHPLRQRLKENDIPPWAASAPIVLTYSGGDSVVPEKQTKKFFSAMKDFPNQISTFKTAENLPHGLNFIRSVKWLGYLLQSR